MLTATEPLPCLIAAEAPLILTMLPSALSNVPFHFDTPAVTRYFAGNFPIHMAVHQVTAGQTTPPTYTLPHVHEDWDEVNIILSPEELVYRIQLGESTYTVRNNACIWIPRGMVHSANVLKGTGYYIAFRFD